MSSFLGPDDDVAEDRTSAQGPEAVSESTWLRLIDCRANSSPELSPVGSELANLENDSTICPNRALLLPKGPLIVLGGGHF